MKTNVSTFCYGTCSVDKTLYIRVNFVPDNHSILWPLFQFNSFIFLYNARISPNPNLNCIT